MKALVFKELREVFGITAIALGAYLVLVLSLVGAKLFDWIPGMPNGTREVPFTGSSGALLFILVSLVFAGALGFRQSATEAARGTFLFLLHRPLARGQVFLTKLATGIGLLVACASVPILLYGTWAAVPGHHAGPFDWSMTIGYWQTVILMPLVYLGAFLSGIRPARWFGTRLLPLFAVLMFLILVGYSSWWRAGLPLELALAALLVVSIVYVAQTRDYA